MSNDALYTPTGNKTEVALLNFLYQNNIEAHVKLSNRQNESEIECVIPFNPIRKSQLTVTRVQKGDKNVRVVLKGAPEAILNHCTHILSEDVSRPIQLSDNLRNQFLNTIYGVNGIEERKLTSEQIKPFEYRCFAYAYKDIDSDEWEELQRKYNNFEKESDRTIIEKDLIMVVCFALEDPLRKDVQKSILKLNQSNIEVRMISGDHLATAKSLAI